MKIGVRVIIAWIVLFFTGIFYNAITGHGFDIGSLDGITISAIGIILVVIGALVQKMKKENTIKKAYEELGKSEDMED